MDFDVWFQGWQGFRPHPWQRGLARAEGCRDRLIRIPTGFGKTQGVFGAWCWHRVVRGDDRWPRRLVWCLPMRVLVEQTEAALREALHSLGLLWEEGTDHEGRVGVHTLMGGSEAGPWMRYPEHCAVLVGTQDMLLSRALNRGYASPRGRWPQEFGLLHQDCLWVMDEVQLMDVGLATSAQLQAFRGRMPGPRPVHTWWMSATLQREWIHKSPDTAHIAAAVQEERIPAEGRLGPLWDDVAKPCTVEPVADPRSLASLVARAHLERTAEGPTLVVVNTVERAMETHKALKGLLPGTDLRLVHSRFRPRERASWRMDFLNRAACAGRIDRVIVATQVVEAGVDLSAGVLVTELAPWPSLVQRFGRCARWGGESRVIVADPLPKDDKAAAPYSLAAMDAARNALSCLSDVSPLHLERFEEEHSDLLPALYPYDPMHLLLAHELGDLFDTSTDLSGADVDISRFIRTGDERDVHVFWASVTGHPAPEVQPSRDSLCAVPFLKARDWLFQPKSESLAENHRAWVWDFVGSAWRRAQRRDLYPGQTVLVSHDTGGYDPRAGWSPKSTAPVVPVPLQECHDLTDLGQDQDVMSESPYQTIGFHGARVAQVAGRLGALLAPRQASCLETAGRWHDTGKAHPAFQGSMRSPTRPDRQDLAKAPESAWSAAYRSTLVTGERRPGFRHELASTLALFGVLLRHQPGHAALRGPWESLLPPVEKPVGPPPTGPEQEILALGEEAFNLVAWLVCSHHGKVRVTWHACPADQEASVEHLHLRGVREGDILPELVLPYRDGIEKIPATRLTLGPAALGLDPHTGPAWTDRVLGLIDSYGLFTLAFLEAILRVADQRASASTEADPALEVSP